MGEEEGSLGEHGCENSNWRIHPVTFCRFFWGGGGERGLFFFFFFFFLERGIGVERVARGQARQAG